MQLYDVHVSETQHLDVHVSMQYNPLILIYNSLFMCISNSI
jgi:hypothetical protein